MDTIKATYTDLRAAGKAIGAAQGFYGKSGGWIYRIDAAGQERVVGQGWDVVARNAGVYWSKDDSAYRVPATVIARWNTVIETGKPAASRPVLDTIPTRIACQNTWPSA